MYFHHKNIKKEYRDQGVYVITNLVNGRQYVGMSRCMSERIRTHFKDLYKNRHPSPPMNEDYKKYGSEAFKVHLLACGKDRDQLLLKEDRFIKLLKPYYNPGLKNYLFK